MQDRNQTGLAITRRGFVQSAIGSIIVLPAIGGVGIFSQRRVAHAAVVSTLLLSALGIAISRKKLNV